MTLKEHQLSPHPALPTFGLKLTQRLFRGLEPAGLQAGIKTIGYLGLQAFRLGLELSQNLGHASPLPLPP